MPVVYIKTAAYNIGTGLFIVILHNGTCHEQAHYHTDGEQRHESHAPAFSGSPDIAMV